MKQFDKLTCTTYGEDLLRVTKPTVTKNFSAWIRIVLGDGETASVNLDKASIRKLRVQLKECLK